MNQYDLEVALRNLINVQAKRIKELEALESKQYREYKEPTTKEIDDLWIKVINNIPANDKRPAEWHFACALLKKASEK